MEYVKLMSDANTILCEKVKNVKKGAPQLEPTSGLGNAYIKWKVDFFFTFFYPQVGWALHTFLRQAEIAIISARKHYILVRLARIVRIAKAAAEVYVS